jgi:zinc D-Ala-D-Ala carboxypeptidase
VGLGDNRRVTDRGTGTPLTRRAARAAAERARVEDDSNSLTDAVAEVRHAARRRARRVRAVFTRMAATVLIVGGTAAVTAAAAGTSAASDPPSAAAASASPSPSASVKPPPVNEATVTTTRNPCTDAEFTAALGAHDTEAAVAAAGGAAAFREEVISGVAPCIHLDDPSFTWVVVDKKRPYAPRDYAPSPLVAPAGVHVINGSLRSDAAAALSHMVDAARHAGAGEIALDSGYRSYRTQVTSYGVQVRSRGSSGADLVSARPGFSEHQSGLAGDVVACSRSCGSLDMLAGTPQDAFILSHAWEYGWIVRYEAGHTPITGYTSEPWHLRFIGVQLAKAYHDGGFHTLEEFFGLPAAPTY